MNRSRVSQCLLLAAIVAPPLSSVRAQVYSPMVLREGAVDTSDLHRMAEGIVRNAHAETPRQKAEAIWRFFLTDGRFVRPGMFYHIPGWSYEEPMGEVLDPIKLVNSYGFGLCYQDAPLLQAMWEAAGMPARVWFLTGHTVAEVFYDGAYHYYDSDMMGYTTVGDGPVWSSPVASVQQLANQPSLILDKLQSEKMTKAGAVDAPWYPADLRAGAIQGLADLFASRDDNYLYAGTRYPNGHTMDFTLRPGERMIRYYDAGKAAPRYLPYRREDGAWHEFPRDWSEILQVRNGPLSEKDERRWSIGLLEYRPDAPARRAAHGSAAEWIYRVASPYVLVDAAFRIDGAVPAGLQADLSTDDGHTWIPATVSAAADHWSAAPARLAKTEHGQHNAVAGNYGYLLRLRSPKPQEDLPGLLMQSLFEFNPRTLPELLPGSNHYQLSESQTERREWPVHASNAMQFAAATQHMVYKDDDGQGYLRNEDGHDGELIFAMERETDGSMREIDAGGRFLNLSGGLAPNKLTGETRPVQRWPTSPGAALSASISWSTGAHGPWTSVWSFEQQALVKGAGPQKVQTLQWPEVDRRITGLPQGSGPVYVRYQVRNVAMDDVRLATVRAPASARSPLTVTHCWTADGKPAAFSRSFGEGDAAYQIDLPQGSSIHPTALVLSAGPDAPGASAACSDPGFLQVAGK